MDKNHTGMTVFRLHNAPRNPLLNVCVSAVCYVLLNSTYLLKTNGGRALPVPSRGADSATKNAFHCSKQQHLVTVVFECYVQISLLTYLGGFKGTGTEGQGCCPMAC